MRNFSSKFITVFSGALAFVAGLLYITDSAVVSKSFGATMSTLFVPAIVGYIMILALVKMKQRREGLAL